MKKIYSILLITFCFYTLSNAQVHTVNIGANVGIADSSIVVQTGTTDSFHVGNHPGFGAYSNAEIYICDNATLKYNYQLGTSSNPIFYLGNNAKLLVYSSFIASKTFMKANAKIECFGGNFMSDELRRESPTTLISAVGTFFDSTFTQVNYTFNGWLNNANPCNAATNIDPVDFAANNINIFPNPVQDILFINNIPNYKNEISCRVYDILGRVVFSQKYEPRNALQINCHFLRQGIYHVNFQNDGMVFKNFVFTKL